MSIGRALGGIIGGPILLAIGIWLGLIGWEETRFGPEGYGVYQVTYPIPGIIMIIMGILGLIGGIVLLALAAQPPPPHELRVYTRDDGPLREPPREPPSEEKKPCEECGEMIPEDSTFCVYCGHSMEED